MTPVILSWSGGKDSALALSALQARAGYEVCGLLTTFTREYDRVSMHGVRRELIQQQAASLGLPLVEVWIDAGCTNVDYEAATAAVLQDWRERGVAAAAYGDLFLTDIRTYREAFLSRLDVTPLFPLWGFDTTALAQTFVAEGYRARLCCVDTRRLPAGLCGRELDAALLEELPEGVDPCGENGEFHTFVYDGPPFRTPIPVDTADERRDGPFVFRDLIPAAAMGSAAVSTPAHDLLRPEAIR